MIEITNKTSLKEIALIVCYQLKQDGIDAVLSGGAVVSIYTENAYQSFDLDFISHAPISKITKSLAQIGFSRTKGRYYTHSKTDFFVEFPSPPIAVGNKPLKTFHEIKTETGYLKLLTPTQCVMDRLAAFYHWNDLQALEQAVLVTDAYKVNLQEIEEWSEEESMLEKFSVFRRHCKK